MSVTASTVASPAGGAPPREWYQVLGQRRVEWLARHPTLARRVAVTRTVVAWLAVVYVAALFMVQPDLRLGMRAWLGALWVVVAWFLLARTKTLTFSGTMRFFAACGVWSAVIAVLLDRVSSSRGMWGASGSGPTTLVAGIGEEALKLVPLVVLGLAAPRRVSRFSAADFALLGVAAGAAFEGVEEAIRRTVYMTDDSNWFMGLDKAFYGKALPPDWVHFGLWPIPSDWDNQGAGFGGHVVTTGIVAALAGLAVVVWRTARRRHLVTRWTVRAIAVAIVLVGLVSVMADHVLYNAQGRASREVLLDPETSALPWWIRVPWSALGHGHYRPAVMVLLIVACLAVDAFRLAARPATNLVPRPAWRPVALAGASLSAWYARSRWGGRAAASTLNALVALVWITGRDLAQQLAAYSRDPGERVLAAIRRGAAMASGQRTARELGVEHSAGRVHPWRARLVAAGALAALLAAAFLLAPDLAAHTSPTMHGGWDWLAGLLDSISRWWNSLSPGQQIAIGLGIAFLVALIPGMSITMAFGISGVLTWGLDKSAGIATFVRDPRDATRSYFTNATPGQLAADTLGVALTFGPGNFAGATLGRGARAVTKEIVDDSAAFRSRIREGVHSDEGGFRPPSGWTSKDYEEWADDLAEAGETGTQRPVGHGDGGMSGSNVSQLDTSNDAIKAVEAKLGRQLRWSERERIEPMLHGQNWDYQRIVDELTQQFWRQGDNPL